MMFAQFLPTLYRSMLPVRQYAQPALWLTLDQAAEYSGLSRALLLRAIANRRIAGFKDGGRWKLKRSSVDAFDPLKQQLRAVTTELRGRKKGAA
jgi:excisionase family DNA binding protein